MLSTAYRGVDRRIRSPHGAQFGEEFGEELRLSGEFGRWPLAQLAQPLLETWSWTERTPESIIAPPALSWDGKAGPLILRSPCQLGHPLRTQTRDLCRDSLAV
jgi:hypothetical protein